MIETHPERALAIYRQRTESALPNASVSAYEAVAAYLRKMQPILQSLGREAEWFQTIADVRLKHANRPRMIEILGRLDAQPILQRRGTRK